MSPKAARQRATKPNGAQKRAAVQKPAAGGIRSIRVNLGDRSYAIRIGTDRMAALGDEVARATGAERVVVITEPALGRRYGPALLRSLRSAGIKADKLEVPPGDSSKSLRQVARLYDAFLERGLDRSACLVALGGGMIGDLTGFAAATYLRGIPFVQVPTTILSMVDASVGGKTGVNLSQGKNLVGAFYQPSLVWIDTAMLESLPRRDRASGLAEVVKAGAIWDERFFRRLERSGADILALDPAALIPALTRACRIKAEVVSRDERESSGLRALLNFGHTLAHAIEAGSRFRGILHGEAVAIGMVHAAGRSEALGFAPAGTRERLRDLLVGLQLPVENPDSNRKAQLSAIGVDKKKVGKKIHYVVLRGIGKAETVPLSPAQILPVGSLRSGVTR